MFPTVGDLLGVRLDLPTHEVFVALGVAAAALVFVLEARRRGHTDERLLWVVVGALVGGGVMMRMGTWLQHLPLRDNAGLAEQWLYGNRSILGGLVGAWLGVHVAKRLVGYRVRTGDLFAPAVALGMAVGRVGCLLTETPGTPTGTGYGIRLDAVTAARLGAPAGVPLHPSFAYEIAFQLAAFVALWVWLRHLSLGARARPSCSTSRRTGCSGSSSSSCAATTSSGTDSPAPSCSSPSRCPSCWCGSSCC